MNMMLNKIINGEFSTGLILNGKDLGSIHRGHTLGFAHQIKKRSVMFSRSLPLTMKIISDDKSLRILHS